MQEVANDSVSEFQSRRRETWRIIRPWVFVRAPFPGTMLARNGDNLQKVLLAETEERLNTQLSLFSLRKDHWEKLAA